MDENLSVQRLYRKLINSIDGEQLRKEQDLGKKLRAMTSALKKLKFVLEKTLALPPTQETASLINYIKYDCGRIHRDRAWIIIELLRASKNVYFEHLAGLVESIYYSGKPLSHFCLVRGELVKWSMLPHHPLSSQPQTSFAATSKMLKLYWNLLKKLFAIRRRG